MRVLPSASARELSPISPVSLSLNVRGLWKTSNHFSLNESCDETCRIVKYSTNKNPLGKMLILSSYAQFETDALKHYTLSNNEKIRQQTTGY